MTKPMSQTRLGIGDRVAASPAGPGVITSFLHGDWPIINGHPVDWVERVDGAKWDPLGYGRGNSLPTREEPPPPRKRKTLMNERIAREAWTEALPGRPMPEAGQAVTLTQHELLELLGACYDSGHSTGRHEGTCEGINWERAREERDNPTYY